jgi:hypothetical protein
MASLPGMRGKGIALAAAAMLGASAWAPAPAPAIHTAKSCGKLVGYTVKAQNVGCRFARRWASRSYHHHRKPGGWVCSYASSRSSIRLFCSQGAKAYFLKK